ncbi:MAG: iron ABC transporter permease, partial [Bacteroidota bacterium]
MALLISIPVLSVLTSVFTPAGDIWEHLANTVLWKYVSNSLLLICGVSILVLIMGVPTAWVVSKYQFTGKRWFNVALFLPF